MYENEHDVTRQWTRILLMPVVSDDNAFQVGFKGGLSSCECHSLVMECRFREAGLHIDIAMERLLA